MKKHMNHSAAPSIGAADYKRKNNIKNKRNMQKMTFITRERLYRFLNQCFISMGLGSYLRLFFDRESVDRALNYFEIGIDTRRMCDGKFASVVPFKDELGKIRDAWMMLFDPKNGTVLQDGDERAMVQNTKKQNQNLPYLCQIHGIKQCSLAYELSQGYDFCNDMPTLMGMNKVNKRIHVLNNVVDVIVMTILCPEYGWVAIAPDQDMTILLHPNITKGLRWKRVILYPQLGSYEEVKKVEYQLSRMGINVKTDSFVEQADFEWKREGSSIATIALNMLSEGFSPQDVISYMGFMDNEPF